MNIEPTPSATCSTEGCDGKKRARGLCMKHYMQLPHVVENQAAYRKTRERKAYQKAYQHTPKRKAYRRAYYLKKKALSTPAQ